MTMLILAITLQLIFGGLIGKPFHAFHLQARELKATVIPFNEAGMPVRVNAMVADNSSTGSWLVYSITNVSQEKIEGTYLRAFIVEVGGKLITTEDGFSVETIDAGTTLQSRIRIRRSIKQNGLSIVAVTKVVGDSGVWEVDNSELERAVKAMINRQPDVGLKVRFEPHTTVTDGDRSEIFKLILEDVTNDNEKSKKLKDDTNLILLRDNLDFDLPQIPNVIISKLDRDEIQKIADKRGKVIYLIYRPFVIEGSRVLARLSLRDEVARRPGTYVPFKFTYLFTCVKRDGRWAIEKSLGYAQS
jgi:hypothetical protein